MKKLFFALSLLPVLAFAQDVVVTEPDLSTLFQQLWDIITNWKNVSPVVSISAISFFLVALTKNSFLRSFLGWDKLGALKVFVAPLLSLIGVLVMVHPFNLANVGIALVSGVGAVALNEILNGVREIPGIKPIWVTVVEFIQKILGGSKK